MLQKDAKARPSSAEIMNKILPPMLLPLQLEKGVFQHVGAEPKLKDTNLRYTQAFAFSYKLRTSIQCVRLNCQTGLCRSFVYQLNSHNLLLSPVHWPMKDTVSHVSHTQGFASFRSLVFQDDSLLVVTTFL